MIFLKEFRSLENELDNPFLFFTSSMNFRRWLRGFAPELWNRALRFSRLIQHFCLFGPARRLHYYFGIVPSADRMTIVDMPPTFEFIAFLFLHLHTCYPIKLDKILCSDWSNSRFIALILHVLLGQNCVISWVIRNLNLLLTSSSQHQPLINVKRAIRQLWLPKTMNSGLSLQEMMVHRSQQKKRIRRRDRQHFLVSSMHSMGLHSSSAW